MTIFDQTLYTHTEVKDALVQKFKEYYGYDVTSSLKDIEEYGIESEIPKIIMIRENDPNTKETYKIGLVVLYQSDTTDCINIRKEFNQNPFK